MRCWVCGNRDGNRAHRVLERANGSRDPFTYNECGACGCLHIESVPPELALHYRGYYAFREKPRRPLQSARDSLRTWRATYLLGVGHVPGWFVAQLFGTPEHWTWLRHVGATRDWRILDVGCGNGSLLRTLRTEGFRHLTGADPFIEAPLDEQGLRIYRAHLRDLAGSYDLAMMHHSLEHMPDQVGAMAAAHRLLGPGAWAVIRVPIVAWAWRTYGTEWVQLDAPRHLVLHSEKSFRMLAERVGFEVARVEYDSTEFQFIGSERYRRGLALWDPAQPSPSRAETLALRRQAARLNEQHDGDQACFYLRRA